MKMPTKYTNNYYVKNKNILYGRTRMWQLKHPEQTRKSKQFQHMKNKIIILQIYSNGNMVCKNCGFDDIDALTIDHINNNGNKHRKEIRSKNANKDFYDWLIRNDFPEGFQVLCMNCNFIKRQTKRLL
jgi:hypothetical protein